MFMGLVGSEMCIRDSAIDRTRNSARSRERGRSVGDLSAIYLVCDRIRARKTRMCDRRFSAIGTDRTTRSERFYGPVVRRPLRKGKILGSIPSRSTNILNFFSLSFTNILFISSHCIHNQLSVSSSTFRVVATLDVRSTGPTNDSGRTIHIAIEYRWRSNFVLALTKVVWLRMSVAVVATTPRADFGTNDRGRQSFYHSAVQRNERTISTALDPRGFPRPR